MAITVGSRLFYRKCRRHSNSFSLTIRERRVEEGDLDQIHCTAIAFLRCRETLPFRSSIRDFDLDPPLTYKGLKDSYHTGESLRRLALSFEWCSLSGTVLKGKNININYCYASPSLRCVQTALKILEGLELQNKVKIR